jgi:hypothetical protein
MNEYLDNAHDYTVHSSLNMSNLKDKFNMEAHEKVVR